MRPARRTLVVHLTKRPDGGAVLRCVRADGSATWQRHDGPHAAFFPLHDLTHLAVESALGAREGFFGLVAAGWDVTDTGGKGARCPLPFEAQAVERLVGLLDAERAGGTTWSAADLRTQLQVGLGAPLPPSWPPLDDARLVGIRADVATLHARWRALDAGLTLTLRFPATAR